MKNSISLFLIISLILIPLSPIPDIQAQENISNIQNLSYTYDNIGNMMSIEDSSVLPTSKTITYTYDDLDRLTSAQTSNLSYGDYTKTYQYDSIGNMVYKSDVGVMSYGGTGFPNPHALTASGTKTYSYDLNGNLLNDTSNQFAWNVRNQLVQSGDYSFTYDYSGQRIKSINASSGEKTIFVNKYLEIRPDSALYYFWAGPTRIASLEISKNAEGSLNDPSTGIITYFHQDHLGSVALATNENGEVIQINDYAPYGSITYNDSSSSSQSPYSFSGKEYSQDLGLYYFEARWYDPEVGHFISPDPIDGISYAYAENNPLRYLDPFGLFNMETGEIEKGDTLSEITWQINDKYHTTYTNSEIAQLNNIENPDKIYIGQKIIPNETIPDITYELSQLMQNYAEEAKFKGPFFFKDQFKTNGDWDLKSLIDSIFYTGNGAHNFVFIGMEIRYDAPGNILYGYVGNATLWANRNLLLYFAGKEQQHANTSTASWGKSNYDDPVDQGYINAGYDLYDVTDGTIYDTLKELEMIQ